MSADIAYLDSSAFVKLVVPEAESSALRAYLTMWPRFASATLLRTEVARAVIDRGPTVLADARRRMRSLLLIQLEDDLLDRAGELRPIGIRSLDAIHLAAALSLGEELGPVVTYDARMAEAATELGLVVATPA